MPGLPRGPPVGYLRRSVMKVRLRSTEDLHVFCLAGGILGVKGQFEGWYMGELHPLVLYEYVGGIKDQGQSPSDLWRNILEALNPTTPAANPAQDRVAQRLAYYRHRVRPWRAS